MSHLKWFPRLADAPGVGYQAHPTVDRNRLPGHDAFPQVSRHIFDGEPHESLLWTVGGTTSTASPAQQWRARERKGEQTVQAILRQLFETLELPGEPEDYHFAIQGCHEALWKHRLDHPEVLIEIERLCWLNIRLIEAHPYLFDDLFTHG